MNRMEAIIGSVQIQLRAFAWLQCLLAGVCAGGLAQSWGAPWECTLAVGLGGSGLYAAGSRPWKNRRNEAIRKLHTLLEDTEYSLGLVEKKTLNRAEQLQMERLLDKAPGLKTPIVAGKGWGKLLLVFAITGAVYFLSALLQGNGERGMERGFRGNAHTESLPAPRLLDARVHIHPPAYTGLEAVVSRDLHVSSVEGTVLKWQVRFSEDDSVRVTLSNIRGNELDFTRREENFEYTDRLAASGLYAIRAYRGDSLVYQSEYYRLEATPDAAPKIVPASRELYRFHFLNDPQNLAVSAKVSDDFLVKEVYLVATVARGAGENVKFREVKFPVTTQPFKAGKVQKTIDLRTVDFSPGDELYYYWAAVDNRVPSPNFSKSDTYFLVYKDTSALKESELMALAVNILPEYFRSQRQIIIDTEKLIAQRGKQAKEAFNTASNAIGFDQKALRIRYGQYLGEEYESSIGGHAHSDDPLEGFVHRHDSEEEGHHDHAHDHHHEEEAGVAAPESSNALADLLEAYLHSHDDAESNTFYEQSTRSVLKTALENMWQSELQLRLYEPEKALPYAYTALELLKEVQQKARVFIARTSYDPPPLKEQELRMKGELKKFNRTRRSAVELARPQVSVMAARVLGYLENGNPLAADQKEETARLSREISGRVLNAGLDQWKVLAFLQKLVNDQPLTVQEKHTVKAALLALSNVPENAQPPAGFSDSRLEKAFWKNLR